MARRRKKDEWDTLASILTWSIIAFGAFIVMLFKAIASFITWSEKTYHNNQIKKRNKINSGDAVTGVILGNTIANKNNKNSKLEKEMDWYGLNEEEKSEVRKGNYDVFNFDEENTEEDDYYHEDV